MQLKVGGLFVWLIILLNWACYSCGLRDRLVVRNRVNDTFLDPLKVFCGSSMPPGVMSSTPYLQMRFEATSAKPQARGFEFYYEFVTGK